MNIPKGNFIVVIAILFFLDALIFAIVNKFWISLTFVGLFIFSIYYLYNPFLSKKEENQ